jgi:hypothetical protein
MPSSSDKEKLLNDLLCDPNYKAFRAEVFDLSRAEFQAGHRRRSRLVYFALAASITILGTVLLFFFRGRPHVQIVAGQTADAVVFQKDQLPTIALIETMQLEPVEVIRSLPDRHLLVSTPKIRGPQLDVIYSDPATVDPVNDAQLLALFPNNTVGFVTTSRGKKLVVFADAAAKTQLPFAKKVLR